MSAALPPGQLGVLDAAPVRLGRHRLHLVAGQARVDLIAAWAEIGMDRIVCFPTKLDPSLEAQAAFAADVRAAGVALDGA